MESREEILNSLHAQRDAHLGSTDLECLSADLVPRLILSNVGEEADNLIPLLCVLC